MARPWARLYECRSHCRVWSGLGDGRLAVVCAHCDWEGDSWRPVDPDGDLARMLATLEAHGRLCGRPSWVEAA